MAITKAFQFFGQRGSKGDKGDEGDITPELEALQDDVTAKAATATAAAATATTQAGIATTQAGIATANAIATAEDLAATSAHRAAAAASAAAAAASEAAAELAATAAQAGSTVYPDEPTGRAAVADGESFWVEPADEDGGLLLYRRIDAVTVSTLLYEAPPFAAVSDLQERMDKVQPVVEKTMQRYLGAPDGVVVRTLYGPNRDKVWDYFKKNSSGDHELVSNETRRLDRLEKPIVSRANLTPDFGGRVIYSADGKVIFGRRNDGLWYLGASAKRQFCVRESNGRILVHVEGVAEPFGISDYYEGENVAPMQHGNHGVSWMQLPPLGAPAIKRSYSLLKGFKPGVRPDGMTKIVLLLLTGQSTAMGSASAPAVTTVCPKPGYLLMHDMEPRFIGTPSASVRALGNGHFPDYVNYPINVSRLGSLTHAYETNQPVSGAAAAGETQCLQAAYEFQKRMGDTVGVVAACVAIGSVGYAEIKKGTVIYNNAIEVARATYAVAKMHGMDFDMIVLWPQQEDDSQLSQSAFLSIITEFQSDFTADISRMSNDEVAEVMFVTNGFTRDPSGAATFSEQTLGQMQFALENHGENNAPETCKSILATPSYILHRAADLIHFTNIAGARDGSYMGRAAANRKLGRDAKPFHITSIAWVSGQIRCNLHLPYDAGTLTETSPWVTDPGQNGFKLQKVSNGSDHPLASVFILGQQIIAVPSPGYSTTDEYELSWALRGPPGNLDGPTTGARCPFNDGSLDTDFFGNPMPNHLASGRANIFLT